MSETYSRRPRLTPPPVTAPEPSRVVVLLSGIFGVALTGAFFAFLIWNALNIAGREDLLSLRELFGIGFGYTTIRSVDLLMVKAINER